MLVVLLVMSSVVAAVMAVLAGGLLLPKRHVVERARDLPAPPDVVWSRLAQPASYAAWQRQVRRVDWLTDAPMQWREFTTDGAFTWACTTCDAPHVFTARVVDEDVQRRPERTLRLRAVDGGTRVTCTEVALHTNPIPRFVYRYLLRPEPQLDALLDDLARAIPAESTPASAR